MSVSKEQLQHIVETEWSIWWYETIILPNIYESPYATVNKVISINPNTTFELICKYPDKPWDWHTFSENPNLTIEWLIKFPDKGWDWNTLSKHPNITIEWLNKFPDKGWHWGILSKHPNLTIEWLNKFPDKPWYKLEILNNPVMVQKEQFVNQRYREHISAIIIQRQWRKCAYNPKYQICKKIFNEINDKLFENRQSINL